MEWVKLTAEDIGAAAAHTFRNDFAASSRLNCHLKKKSGSGSAVRKKRRPSFGRSIDVSDSSYKVVKKGLHLDRLPEQILNEGCSLDPYIWFLKREDAPFTCGPEWHLLFRLPGGDYKQPTRAIENRMWQNRIKCISDNNRRLIQADDGSSVLVPVVSDEWKENRRKNNLNKKKSRMQKKQQLLQFERKKKDKTITADDSFASMAPSKSFILIEPKTLENLKKSKFEVDKDDPLRQHAANRISDEKGGQDEIEESDCVNHLKKNYSSHLNFFDLNKIRVDKSNVLDKMQAGSRMLNDDVDVKEIFNVDSTAPKKPKQKAAPPKKKSDSKKDVDDPELISNRSVIPQSLKKRKRSTPVANGQKAVPKRTKVMHNNEELLMSWAVKHVVAGCPDDHDTRSIVNHFEHMATRAQFLFLLNKDPWTQGFVAGVQHLFDEIGKEHQFFKNHSQ